MTSRILQPGEIETLSSSQIPFLRLPDSATLFAQRAERLRQLAENHTLGDYLRLIAHIADAQQRCLDQHAPVAPPAAQHLQHCRDHGMPPLGALGLPRDAMWQAALARIIAHVKPHMPAAARAAADVLLAAAPDQLENFATALLSGETQHLNPANAPLLAAALQVYWVRLAAQLGSAQFPRIEPAHLCPVCGSRPVASIARIGAQESGYRYLHCALCSAEWHMVRIKCSHCESTKGIAYHHIDNAQAIDTNRSPAMDRSQAIKTESCDECNSYAKIVYMERDPQVEPTADDLASLALDLLVSDMGYQRSTPNLMLLHGPE
jgi:FdhE protein